jgi:NADH:ubiquinone oxidoreductase subunit K
MELVVQWLPRIAITLFFIGLLGCLIVIPRTAIVLLMAALDTSDKDD